MWGVLFYQLCDFNYIKQILEYNGSSHQLKRWSRELLVYECVIIYRPAAKKNYADGIYRYIYHLVYQYFITTSRLHLEDVVTRSFVYSFDVFIRCNNPHNPLHITLSDTLSISITTSSISSIPTLYCTPINFSTVFNFDFVTNIFNPDPECHVLPFPVASLLEISQISIDSVINSLVSALLRQGYHTIHHFIYESNHLSSFLQNFWPEASIYLTIFYHTLSSLQKHLLLLSTNPFSSSNIILKWLVHLISLSKLFAPHSIVSNRIVSHSIVPNRNILSHDIVNNHNLLLAKHVSYPFPSAST